MEREGNCAISTEISSVRVHKRTACLNDSVSNECSSSFQKYFRFRDARLHAVSSRNMYSEQGLLALMRPSFGQVCHSLIVVSNCNPGSAEAHAAYEILSHNCLAFSVSATVPV